MQVTGLIVSYFVTDDNARDAAFLPLSCAAHRRELKYWTWCADLAVPTRMDSFQFAKYTVIIL